MCIWWRAGNHWFVSNFGWTHAVARGIMFHWKLQRKPSIAVLRSKQISFRFILSWQIFTNSLNKFGQLATEIFWLTPDLNLGTALSVVSFSYVDCWRNVWTNTLTIIKKQGSINAHIVSVDKTTNKNTKYFNTIIYTYRYWHALIWNKILRVVRNNNTSIIM